MREFSPLSFFNLNKTILYMACSTVTLKGINVGCKDSTGGIKEVYLVKAEDVTKVTALEGKVTEITMNLEAKFQTYKFRKGTGNMVSTLTTDEAAGTMSVGTDLNLQFSKQETAKRLEIMGMCMEEMKAIVKDQNNKYWFLGFDNPISASAATGNTGTAFADFNGYNVTLHDDSKEFPMEIDEEVVTPLINPAPVA